LTHQNRAAFLLPCPPCQQVRSNIFCLLDPSVSYALGCEPAARSSSSATVLLVRGPQTHQILGSDASELLSASTYLYRAPHFEDPPPFSNSPQHRTAGGDRESPQLVFQMASWARMRNRVTSLSKSKAVRRYFNLLLRIVTFILILSILLQFILAYIIAKDPRILPPALRRAKNLLIVTAHPDDECLFFSPAILGVLDGNPDTKGGLIVLSSGLFLFLQCSEYFLTHYRKQLWDWRKEKSGAERLLQVFEYRLRKVFGIG
jgi:hypothetical protein